MQILTSEDLLKQQLSEISEKKIKSTKPVEIAKGVGVKYNAELQEMVNMIRADISNTLNEQIKSLEFEYTADSWVDIIQSSILALKSKWSNEIFQAWANRTASTFVQAVNLQNQKQMTKQFSRFGIDVFNANSVVSDYLQASIADNTQLIQSIASQYLERVETIVITNMRAGMRPSKIEQQLVDQFGVTKRRARMIARDQTSKTSNGLARKRMQASGVEYFQWITSKDERVRSRHRRIANKMTAYGLGVYKWDNLPLSDSGEPIACGDDYQCRCIARPVLEREVRENQRQGKVVKGVYK